MKISRMEAGPPPAVCPPFVINETLLFAEKFGILAPPANLFTPTGPPFGAFGTNGSVVEQFCNRCAHRFFQLCTSATLRA